MISQPYLHRSELVKTCFLYGNRWISWCLMRIAELFERSVSWNKCLVDYLGDCPIHCLKVTMWFSVPPDWRWPVTATFNAILSTSRHPALVQWCRRSLIVSLVVVFLPWKKSVKLWFSLDIWFRREIGLWSRSSPTRNSYCLIHEGWEKNFGALAMINWKTQDWVNFIRNDRDNKIDTFFLDHFAYCTCLLIGQLLEK